MSRDVGGSFLFSYFHFSFRQAVQREKIDPQVFVNGALVPLLRKVGCDRQEAAPIFLGCALLLTLPMARETQC